MDGNSKVGSVGNRLSALVLLYLFTLVQFLSVWFLLLLLFQFKAVGVGCDIKLRMDYMLIVNKKSMRY